MYEGWKVLHDITTVPGGVPSLTSRDDKVNAYRKPDISRSFGKKTVFGAKQEDT